MKLKDDRNNYKVTKTKGPCVGYYENLEDAIVKTQECNKPNMFTKSKRTNYIDAVLKSKK